MSTPTTTRVPTLRDVEIYNALRAGHSIDTLAEIGVYRRTWTRTDVERIAQHVPPPPPLPGRRRTTPTGALPPSGPWNPPTPPTRQQQVTVPPRMAQVLTGICKGHSNAQIAAQLFVTEDTVKTHVRRLLKVFDARDRAHVAALACSGALTVTIARQTRRAAS